MPRTDDRRRPALTGKELFDDQRRHKSQRLGIDPDRVPAVCVRIDPRTGERVEIIERKPSL